MYDKQTASYPFESLSKWMNMTNHITEPLFNRFTNASKPSFILDEASPHLYHYTPTINITQLIKPSRDQSLFPIQSSLKLLDILPLLSRNCMLIRAMS